MVSLTFNILIHLIDLRRILSRETRSIPARSIHADGLVVCSRPLAPAIVILRCWIRSVVSIQDIRQRLNPQVPAVVLVSWPRLHGNLCQHLHNIRIKTKRQFDPALHNVLRILRRIPSQCAIGIQIRQRWMTAQPRSIGSNIHDCRRSSEWAVEAFPTDDIADDGSLVIDPEVKIKNSFPERWEVNEMTLLPQILLRDL